MQSDKNMAGGSQEPLALFSGSIVSIVLRLGGLAIIDAFALWLFLELLAADQTIIGATILLITLGLNAIFLIEDLYPFRWLSPGLALIVLMVIYPVLITVYYAFTNYSTGNLLTEGLAIERIEEKPEYRFLPAGEEYYDQYTYGSLDNVYPDAADYGEDTNEYLLWLIGRDTGTILIAEQEGDITPLTDYLANGEVFALENYTFVSPDDLPNTLSDAGVESLAYGDPWTDVQITPVDPTDENLPEGVFLDPEQQILVDNSGNRPRTYRAFVFQNEDQFAVWALRDDETTLAMPDEELVEADLPNPLLGFERLQGAQRTRPIVAQGLSEVVFGDPSNPIKVDAVSASRAGRFEQRYEYRADDNTMFDKVTGAIYEVVDGTFVLIEGSAAETPLIDTGEELEVFEELSPGYFVFIGLDNFERLFTDERLRDPFVTIFVWTIVHAALSVLITFALGLALAMLLNDTEIPYRKVWRSLILIPYAIPAFISAVMWRGMFDPNLGIINDTLAVFGAEQSWYNNGTAARFAILAIQLWLGFPYMMLICTGALQALPGDIYEAAEVDGATVFHRFRYITLPLLLVAVGPLLIASFAFNFNNFTIIELYNSGGPAIPNSSIPAGKTDILITYTYAQAFGTGGNTDYAFASAITIFIFLIVAAITIFNFRFTKAWEEVSENV